MSLRSFVIALSLSALPGAQAAAPPPTIDACALLDAAQIEQVIGQPVAAGARHDAGVESNGAWSSSCIWKFAPAATDAAQAVRGFVILNAMQWPPGSKRAHEFLDAFRDAAAQGVLAQAPRPRPFGDEALWWGDGLAVRKGDVSFGVSVVQRGPAKTASAGAAEARLAPLILEKLDGRPAQPRRPTSVRS